MIALDKFFLDMDNEEIIAVAMPVHDAQGNYGICSSAVSAPAGTTAYEMVIDEDPDVRVMSMLLAMDLVRQSTQETNPEILFG